ncbi:MAG: carbon storage regulator CsrA [Spirochaetales bacterium]|nr:carbon storage regulator CsrA [Spirochaetales bacterium]
MLILSRRKDESIIIDDKIEVSIVDIKGDQVKLGINAPRSVKIYRQEVYREIEKENAAAAQSSAAALASLGDLFKKK